MSSRRLVLFDIDGTLMRGAGPHHKDALIEGARAVLGVRCTLDGVETAGRLDRDLLEAMLRNARVGVRKFRPNFSRIMEAAQHHYHVHCKLDLSGCVCPGVRETLTMLQANSIPMGIVTGNLSAIAWRKLELARIADYFSFGAFAEQAKSRARLVQLAVSEAKKKELAAKRCAVTLIGDHANDVEAAKLNGCRSVAVATGMMRADQLSALQPDLVLESLKGASLETICGY